MNILLYLTLCVAVSLVVAGCTPSEAMQSVLNPDISKKSFLQREVGLRALTSTAITSSELTVKGDCGSTIYRFIEGQDQTHVVMTAAQKAAELNDIFARSVLCSGESSASLKLITDKLDQVTPPLIKKQYVVAEGGQIAASQAIPASAGNRNMRYAVTWTDVNSNVQVLGSSAPPSDSTSNFLQVIAFDENKKLFNFYERLQKGSNVFFWAGDTSLARKDKTIGKGCFDCHHNGVPIMKELSIPWNNWGSERANIINSVVEVATRKDPPFANKIGAQELEPTIKGASSSYYPRFIRSHINDDFTQVTNVPELLRFVIEDTTVNLQSNNPVPGTSPTFVIPSNFWLSDSMLRSFSIGLDYSIPQSIAFSSANYQAFLRKVDSKLVQCELSGPEKTKCASQPMFSVPGSTHFSAFMPVPANEDVLMSALLTRATVDNKLLKLVSPRFVASILMVDFQNPLFSHKRASLMKYAQAVSSATISGSTSNMDSLFAARVANVANNQPVCTDITLDTCSAEQQFMAVWSDANWKNTSATRIDTYFKAVDTHISCLAPPCEGQDDYLKLLISRHRQLAATPPLGNLVEFSLLFPFSNVPPTPFLRMTATGKVVPDTSL
ncbi:MAG: hypothetical protein ACN4GM_00760 [Gammaproteobacteria bacterium]